MKLKVFAVVALLFLATAAMADIVTNGGFETGTKIAGDPWFFTAPTWIVTDPSGASGVCSTGTCGAPFAPHTGSRAFWGGGYNGFIGLASQALGTGPGTYTLEFYLANLAGAPNSWYVEFNGVTLESWTDLGTFGYGLKSYNVTATGVNDVLSFGFNNELGAYLLDDVKMTQTPEPASLFLLGTGLAGLALRLRRR